MKIFQLLKVIVQMLKGQMSRYDEGLNTQLSVYPAFNVVPATPFGTFG